MNANYFNYFTEIEEHFQRKRGVQVWLSPVDWALIATWREAGIPLAVVLAGIDQAFEKFETGRRRDTQRHRSLVYCAPAVMEAADAARAAAVGAASQPEPPAEADDQFSAGRIATHLESADAALAACPWLDPSSPAVAPVVAEVRATLRRLLESLIPHPGSPASPPSAPDLDRVLSVLDDKLFATLVQAAPVDVMTSIRADIERDLAPYRRKLRVEQLTMIERQFLQRKLLEAAKLPRLSLFYLS